MDYQNELTEYLQPYCDQPITTIKVRRGKYQIDIYGDYWKSYLLIVT